MIKEKIIFYFGLQQKKIEFYYVYKAFRPSFLCMFVLPDLTKNFFCYAIEIHGFFPSLPVLLKY